MRYFRHFISLFLALQLSGMQVAFASTSQGGTFGTDIALAPPTHVYAQQVGSNPAISWVASPHEAAGNIDGYKVYYKLSTDGSYSQYKTVYVDTRTAYIFTGGELSQGQTYDFMVTTLTTHSTESSTTCSDCYALSFTPTAYDADIDGDTSPNESDTDIDGDSIPNSTDTDIDGDGIPNQYDLDVDGDSEDNESDTDIDGDGTINGDDTDMDADGIDNDTDTDTDGDARANTIDTEPNGDSASSTSTSSGSGGSRASSSASSASTNAAQTVSVVDEDTGETTEVTMVDNNALPLSDISITDNTAIDTYSRESGSATIRGTARDTDGTISRVDIEIHDTTQDTYWNGISWQSTSTYVLARAVDNALDSTSEEWEYISLPNLTPGSAYIIRTWSRDNDSARQDTPGETSFTYEPGTFATTLDINTFITSTTDIIGTAGITQDALTGVDVQITRISDAATLTSSGWSLGTSWITATPTDGSFDTGDEAWHIDAITDAFFSQDAQYAISVRARNGSYVQADPLSKTVVFDTSTPEISPITAGPNADTRDSFFSRDSINTLDAGSDQRISFSWSDPNSSSDDTFYYLLDTTSEATSIPTDFSGDSVQQPYVDDIELSEGINYFHVRTQNGNGIWGEEVVFEITYDGTIPYVTSVQTAASDGTYTPSDTVPLDITFSEEVTSLSDVTVHLNSNAQITIPRISTPTTQVRAEYIVSSWDTSVDTLDIVLIEGMLQDVAGNIMVNPAPVQNISTTHALRIEGARIDMITPSEAGGGTYSTESDDIQLRVIAPDASDMRISSSTLSGARSTTTIPLDTWASYTNETLTLTLDGTTGTRLIAIDIRDENNNESTISVFVSRIATTDEVADNIVANEETLTAEAEEIQEAITNAIPESVDLGALDPSLLAELFVATQTEDENAITESREQLLQRVAEIESLQNTLDQNGVEAVVDQLMVFLSDQDMQLVQVFSIEEVNRIISEVDAETLASLAPYLRGISLEINDDIDTITAELQTIGMRDTDGDGLSDKLEIEFYGTNPYLADSDGDGFSDGAEILDYGIDPLVFDQQIKPRLTNIDIDQIITSPFPVLKGTGQFGEDISVVAVPINGADNIELASQLSPDQEGKWLISPENGLVEGIYNIELRDSDGTALYTVPITVDLDFVLPAPSLLAAGSTSFFSASILDSDGLVFAESKPIFYGNTYYGSTIVASFQSVMVSTSVIADNPEGDFEIRPPYPLPAGDHTLTYYAELPDGTRSEAQAIRFTIDPTQAQLLHARARAEELLSLQNIILMLLLMNIGTMAWYVVQSKRNKAAVA